MTKPTTVDEYIDGASTEGQRHLRELRAILGRLDVVDAKNRSINSRYAALKRHEQEAEAEGRRT